MRRMLITMGFALNACATTNDPTSGTSESVKKISTLQVEDPDFATCPKRAEDLMKTYPKRINQASCYTGKSRVACDEEDPEKCSNEDRSYLMANFVKPTNLKRYEKTVKKDLGCKDWVDKMAKKFEKTYLISEEVGTDDEWICMVHTFAK